MEVAVKAHMPGLVARVVVNEGDKVAKGQEVAVINCMKTELSVRAEEAGIVTGVLVKEWDEMEIGNSMIMMNVDQG